METVLLIGGRSFLGGHICRVLLNRGYKVILQSRSSTQFPNLTGILPNSLVETVRSDLENISDIHSIIKRVRSVIYCAIPYSIQSLGVSRQIHHEMARLKMILATLAASSVRRSVFVSVSGTIGRRPGGMADESTPLDRRAMKSWGHLTQKLTAEEMILGFATKGLQATIVNPSMCIGEFDCRPSTGEFFRFIAKSPIAVMPNSLLNIVDVRDVALGVVLALERGQAASRYILSGNNTTMGSLINRIRTLEGKALPSVSVPRSAVLPFSYTSEILNLIVRRPKPIVPLLGIELIDEGSQHLSCGKARNELGFFPSDAWDAVDRAYLWYKDNGVL